MNALQTAVFVLQMKLGKAAKEIDRLSKNGITEKGLIAVRKYTELFDLHSKLKAIC